MSIYDNRETPAYRGAKGNPTYLENKFILDWWTSGHDHLLEEQISKLQWCWYWEIRDRIVEITPPNVIENWKNKDPLCNQYAWYNITIYSFSNKILMGNP
jgi:hypothetical protein